MEVSRRRKEISPTMEESQLQRLIKSLRTLPTRPVLGLKVVM
jgi:hypothetical protein